MYVWFLPLLFLLFIGCCVTLKKNQIELPGKPLPLFIDVNLNPNGFHFSDSFDYFSYQQIENSKKGKEYFDAHYKEIEIDFSELLSNEVNKKPGPEGPVLK